MRPRIYWALIPRALLHYKTYDYEYIEVPWVISEEALRVTLPSDRVGHRTQDGPLVGSAEQGFVQMYLDGELNGIEIGSYGYRSYRELHWIYGTGLAEPRFTLAQKSKAG